MKRVEIVYNPFLLTTKFIVDGKKPRENSSLDFRQQRLQDWAKKLPQLLLDEYRDKNIAIEFTGTLDDFEDLEGILSADKSGVHFESINHHLIPDIESIETQLLKIFSEIQDGPIEELKDNKIIKSFSELFSSETSVSIFSNMASGETTLINAIVGYKILPEDTTFTQTIRIITSNRKDFAGIALNSNGKQLYKQEPLTQDVLKIWALDNTVSSIDIYGPVPCASSIGFRLVLTLMPRQFYGKNLYHMFETSVGSINLFVLDATRLGIASEVDFLSIFGSLQDKRGRQSRDNVIFAVNKLDVYEPQYGDKVQDALNFVRDMLDDMDIRNPNLFPISALSALEIRTKEEYSLALDSFIRKCNYFGNEFRFETYNEYNNLSLSSRRRVHKLTESNHEYDRILAHTGIPSIEESIRTYVNHHVRPLKVKTLADVIYDRLCELILDKKTQLPTSEYHKYQWIKSLSAKLDRLVFF